MRLAVTTSTVVLVALSVLAHELAHGYTALAVGDDTAQRAGRLSWNPLRHVDPWLTVVVPLACWLLSHGTCVLGGAKPVPVSPMRYREPERGDVLVSLAGVTANAIILLAAVVLRPLGDGLGLGIVAARVIAINAALIVFNLLPIPPLDGWRVARCVIRARRRRRALALLALLGKSEA